MKPVTPGVVVLLAAVVGPVSWAWAEPPAAAPSASADAPGLSRPMCAGVAPPLPESLPYRTEEGDGRIAIEPRRFIVPITVFQEMKGVNQVAWASPFLLGGGLTMIELPATATGAALDDRCAAQARIVDTRKGLRYLHRRAGLPESGVFVITQRINVSLAPKAELRDLKNRVEAVGRARVTRAEWLKNGYALDFDLADYPDLPEICEQLLELPQVKLLMPELVQPFESRPMQPLLVTPRADKP
jgi:hypothetical protein